LVELGADHRARARCGVLGAATVLTKHVLADVPPLTFLMLQLTSTWAFS
jgi:hypothetical protein